MISLFHPGRHFRAFGLLTLPLFIVLAGCGGSSSNPGDGSGGGSPPAYNYEPPADTGDGWSVGNAGDFGLSVERLEGMMDAIGSGEFPIIDSIAIASQGTLVFDETIRTRLDEKDSWVANNDLSLHAQFSASKSIASILVGIAIERGYIDSVEVPYLSLFDYPGYENWDERKSLITLHDVLTMRLGLEWDEWNPSYSDPDNALIAFLNQHHDYSKALLDLPMDADPGTSYAYNTVATISLGQAIQNRAPLALADFLSTFLLEPLQISQVRYTQTPTGLPDLGGGLYLYSRDMAKFGQMYMDEGRWNGQQIVSNDWVVVSTQSYTDIGWSEPATRDWQIEGYGYQWWLGHFESGGQQLPTFAALGYGQQLVMVIPNSGLVIAVNSKGYEELADQRNQVYRLITRYILPTSP